MFSVKRFRRGKFPDNSTKFIQVTRKEDQKYMVYFGEDEEFERGVRKPEDLVKKCMENKHLFKDNKRDFENMKLVLRK